MAQETLRRCDVFKSLKGVDVYTIEVKRADGHPAWSKTVDLGQRGLDRLKRFLVRGTTPPAKPEAEKE